jgi:hypothetical protein
MRREARSSEIPTSNPWKTRTERIGKNKIEIRRNQEVIGNWPRNGTWGKPGNSERGKKAI